MLAVLPASACGSGEGTSASRPAQTTQDAAQRPDATDASAGAPEDQDAAEGNAGAPAGSTDAGSTEAGSASGLIAATTRDGGLRILDGTAVCPSAANDSCAFFTRRGVVFAGYGATPLPESITFPVRLKVLRRYPATFQPITGENETVFDVTSSPPVSEKEVLVLDHGPPGTFRHETLPEEVVYDKGGGYTNCSGGQNPGGPEPISLGYSALRTVSGELLLQSTSALIRPNGVVEPVEGKDDTRPYDLRWVEADCAPCGPRSLRTVAIEVTLKGESTPLFKLLPGERKPLKINGIAYNFRLNNASVHPDPHYCGTSGWAVYRADLAIGE